MKKNDISSNWAAMGNALQKETMRKCLHCGVEMLMKGKKRYCSEKCRYAAKNAARAKNKSHAENNFSEK